MTKETPKKEDELQKVYLELQMLDQHMKQLQQQLQMIHQQGAEMAATLQSLDDFTSLKEGKEMWIPLSSGIFAKATLKETEHVLVNVGANVAVTKDIPATKQLINEQVAESEKIQHKLITQIENLSKKADDLQSKMRALSSR